MRSKKNIAITAVIVLLLAAAGYAIYHATRPAHKANVSGKGVNLDPPSKADLQATEQHKKDLEAQANKPATQTPAGTAANVTITYLTLEPSSVSAAGLVTNVFEDGGNCVLTLAKDGMNLTASSTGVADVSKTVCPSLEIDRSQLSSGTWTATLAYSSAKFKGTSAPREITIP